MSHKNTGWRNNLNPNDSDEDSAYESQNNSKLNDSASSASTAIALINCLKILLHQNLLKFHVDHKYQVDY